MMLLYFDIRYATVVNIAINGETTPDATGCCGQGDGNANNDVLPTGDLRNAAKMADWGETIRVGKNGNTAIPDMPQCRQPTPAPTPCKSKHTHTHTTQYHQLKL